MTTAPRQTAKILYVASTASHLRRFHLPYIEALRKEAEVMLLASGDDSGFLDFNVPFEKNMLSTANLKTVFQIRKILKANRFDAVILHTSLAAFLVRAAMMGMRKRPYVHNVVHGYLFNEPLTSKKEHVLHFCERIMRKKTDTITVMNEHDLKIVNNNRFCKEESAFIYGMGVDMPMQIPTPDAALRAQYAKQNEMICTFVGELSNRKNQAFLIDAMKRIKEKELPVKLLLVGEGGERANLEEQIKQLGLSEVIFMLGNREPVLPYLAITDLYVSASRIEGLPFNIMEAMACGLPILASATKGQTDLLDKTPEALYPEGDMETFCNGVERICKSGAYGVGTCEYPVLERYRLASVFEENLALLKKGWC